MFQFEWLIIEVIVVGLLGWQLWSVRRTIRQDREVAARKKLDEVAGAVEMIDGKTGQGGP